MPERRFLLWLLTGIFTFQACTFGVGLFYCAQHKGLESCPKIGERYDQTFNIMVATCLALLTGASLGKND
jgi:hypothetical protein